MPWLRNVRRVVALLFTVPVLLGIAPGARAQSSDDDQAEAPGVTPPRLSYTDGDVSFWRHGAQDWVRAQINTPLAPGDELATGHPGNVELQVGARGFVRAWGDTQLGLVNQQRDLVQIKVTAGHVALDLRNVDPDQVLHVGTPHAAFAIGQPGYYRVDVVPAGTSFVARRGGRASMRASSGQSVVIESSQAVTVNGTTVRTAAASELDVWDRWNQARTDEIVGAVSARYVPPGVYGAHDLDRHGRWQTAPDYGTVWVPQAVPAGWVPYSTGTWVADPVYGWTWVDTAPWGWAPYHHGRWVHVNGVWAWAPGPVVARAVYAPALVAFFGGPRVTIGVRAPFVSWVALGWGEPLVPWWGRPGFVARPSWAGWGGPRVVNNVVVNRTTVVNVTNVNVYRNVGVRNAVVAVPQDHFGRRPVHVARVGDVDVRRLEPVRGPLRISRDDDRARTPNGHALRRRPDAESRRHLEAQPEAGSSRPGAPSQPRTHPGHRFTTQPSRSSAAQPVTTSPPTVNPAQPATTPPASASPAQPVATSQPTTQPAVPPSSVSSPQRIATPPSSASPGQPAVTSPASASPAVGTPQPAPDPQHPALAPRRRAQRDVPDRAMTTQPVAPRPSTRAEPATALPPTHVPVAPRESAPVAAPPARPVPVAPRDHAPAPVQPARSAPMVAPTQPVPAAPRGVVSRPEAVVPVPRAAVGAEDAPRHGAVRRTDAVQPSPQPVSPESANRHRPGRPPAESDPQTQRDATPGARPGADHGRGPWRR